MYDSVCERDYYDYCFFVLSVWLEWGMFVWRDDVEKWECVIIVLESLC